MRSLNYIVLFICYLCNSSLTAQNINIISTKQVNNKILIKYDNKGTSGKYVVKLFVRPTSTQNWSEELNSLRGDVGYNQSPGRNKLIIWDVIQDRDKLVGEYVFGIQAKNLTILEKEKKENEKLISRVNKEKEKSLKCRTGPINAYLSLIYPGLGTYNVGLKQQGIKKMKSFSFFAATTVFSKIYSNVSYNKYLNSTNQSEIDKYYQNANVLNKIFLGSFLVSACFYIEDFSFSLKRGKLNKRKSELKASKERDFDSRSNSSNYQKGYTHRKVNSKL